MQTLRKKNSPCKLKKEPTRFLGEGVSFKAKLIGILEVSEARGDRMCQAALADLKMAIRAAGEHKQRIAVQVSIDGLRLRDEKTGECLYHHPVHKISFIAQDMHDSRAFGYIFGSPDTGHRFFGIKTDKAANQVVIAMRDLFQVVFELKKKEIELAKQHIDQNSLKLHQSGIAVEPQPDTKGASSSESCSSRQPRLSSSNIEKTKIEQPLNRNGIMADLLDLQFELHSLQQGIHQMDKITPDNPCSISEDPFEPDPFGDSFININVKNVVQPILPPPPQTSTKRSHLEQQQQQQQHIAPISSSSTSSSPTVVACETPPPVTTHWHSGNSKKRSSDSDNSKITANFSNDTEIERYNEPISSSQSIRYSPQIHVFRELDPLGTGLSKPYVDKKDFFQHLKNPPKKVLKDLGTTSCDKFSASFDASIDFLDPIKSQKKCIDIFETEEFANFDKFKDSDVAVSSQTPSPPPPPPPPTNNLSQIIQNKPLSVCLPPEEKTIRNFRKIEKEISEPVTSLIHLVSPKEHLSIRDKNLSIDSSSNFCCNHSGEKGFPVDFRICNESPASPLRSCSSDANSRLSNSSIELDVVPEPPPRDSGVVLIDPPPLPPKKQSGKINNPPPRPPVNESHFYYDFIGYQGMTPSPIRKNSKSPAAIDKDDMFENSFRSSSPQSNLLSANIKTGMSSSSRFEDSFDKIIPSKSPSSSFKMSSTPENKRNPSLDITLSQLTSANLNELATSLNMTVTELTSSTLQQLAQCLARLSENNTQNPNQQSKDKESSKVSTNTSSESDTKGNFKTQESSNDRMYDKYAVFRELLELEQLRDTKAKSPTADELYEKTVNENFKTSEDGDNDCQFVVSNSLSKSNGKSRLTNEVKNDSKTDINVQTFSDININSTINTETINIKSSVVSNIVNIEQNGKDKFSQFISESGVYSKSSSDRYAALREIKVDDDDIETFKQEKIDNDVDDDADDNNVYNENKKEEEKEQRNEENEEKKKMEENKKEVQFNEDDETKEKKDIDIIDEIKQKEDEEDADDDEEEEEDEDEEDDDNDDDDDDDANDDDDNEDDEDEDDDDDEDEEDDDEVDDDDDDDDDEVEKEDEEKNNNEKNKDKVEQDEIIKLKKEKIIEKQVKIEIKPKKEELKIQEKETIIQLKKEIDEKKIKTEKRKKINKKVKIILDDKNDGSSVDHNLINFLSEPRLIKPKKYEKSKKNIELTSLDFLTENSDFTGTVRPSKMLPISSCGSNDILLLTDNNNQRQIISEDDYSWAKFETNESNSNKNLYINKNSFSGTSPWSPDEKEIITKQPRRDSLNRRPSYSENEWHDVEEIKFDNPVLKNETFPHRNPRLNTKCEDMNYFNDPDDRHVWERSKRKPRNIIGTKGDNYPQKIGPSSWNEDKYRKHENRRDPPRQVLYVDEEENPRWKRRNSLKKAWIRDRDPHRVHEPQLYDEDVKRRVAPTRTKDDRESFSSQESMEYDEEERWYRREYDRRRWEEDRRFWNRRSDDDYSVSRKFNIHGSRDGRERSMDMSTGWDDEYGVKRQNSCLKYSTGKRNWPQRPSSSTDDRNIEAIYGEPRVMYRVSRSDCSEDSELYHHFNRSRNKDYYWESDQEFDNKINRSYRSERPDAEVEYVQCNRTNRNTLSGLKSQSSPFEDDFTQVTEHRSMDSLDRECMLQSAIPTQRSMSPITIEDDTKQYTKKFERTNCFQDDFRQSVTSNVTEKRILISEPKPIKEDTVGHTENLTSVDSFDSDDGRDFFPNTIPRFDDDDAFAFKADSALNSSSGLIKDQRQITYGNNKMKDNNIKKSESVNIFARKNDPFDNDDFFN